MNNNIKTKRKRPLSHKPLLKFHHEENFLYDPKFMSDEIWREKYNLKNLREKWNQKVKTNFLNMDIKFGSSNIKKTEKNKLIYHDLINKNNLFLIRNSSLFYPFLNKKPNLFYWPNEKDKYNDKISYYLTNRNPWNNKTSIEINKDNNKIDFNVHDKLQKEYNIRNKLKNCNEEKNIIVKCLYYNNKYLRKKEKIKDLMDKYIEEMTIFVNNKYAKEIKFKRYGKSLHIKILIFKEIIKRFYELYKEIISNSKKNVYNNQILYKNNSENNIFLLKNDNNNKIIRNTYEELVIIINYLKQNKNLLNDIKNKKYLIQNFFDVFEKNEDLKSKDINYVKYLKSFEINDIPKNNLVININNKEILNNKKKNSSCPDLKNSHIQKKKNAEYNITFYHPGTYYLFNKGENEYHAWSCCMNDDKKSKGCCKRVQRQPYFNFDFMM
jgi:hypothetical protein